MKLAVLYHSKSGNTKKMAEAVAEGMRRQAGAEVGVFSIDELDEAFVKESCCVVLGTPTYMASITAHVKDFLDNRAGKLGLAGKLGGAFATQRYLHGGADLAIQSVLSHMMVFGMMTYSGGGSFGVPVIHLGPVALGDNVDDYTEVFATYGERMSTKAAELFG